MRAALATHNAIIRAAKWKHYGSTLDQEGDSFTLVFYDPFDAVAFAMEAQQALSEADWPEGLLDPIHRATSPPGSLSPRLNSLISSLRAGRDTLVRSLRSAGSTLGSQSARREAVQHPSVSRLKSPSPRNSPASRPASPSDVSINFSPAPCPAALDGLRVRIGVATGFVGTESTLRSNAVLTLAKEIGEVAQGGQTLMDGGTFARVKERAGELGASCDRSESHLSSLSLAHLSTRCFPGHVSGQDALFLDMGKFSGKSHRADEQELVMYQVLSPSLAARAVHFGGVSVPPLRRTRVSQGIVSAPALFSTPGPFLTQAVPSTAVSIVFCCFSGQKKSSPSHQEAVTAHVLITQAMETDLMTNGGYMCRALPLSYLLAFPSPSLAITFCLRVQEALKSSPWPDDEAFPLMKAGITHDVPDLVLVSHDGRADYHGHGVNMAARMLDVAAGEGMIVCESGLASEAFEEMRLVSGGSTKINAWRIGAYEFKGSGEIKELVAISTESTPPIPGPARGKGRKVYEQEGLFKTVHV
jgi:class 3 adenylate cyclase